ncbi:prepilin peptidase [Tsuneonella sp. HG222]
MPSDTILLAALGAILGSVAGSYLATVLWRLPRGGSANTGRSVCDACGTTLPWHAIIPLAGILLSRGKCAKCGERISRQHLALEVASALCGAWLFAVGQPLLAPLVWLLLVLAVFDALYLWLPNHLVAATAVAALIAPAPEGVELWERLAGGAAGFGVLWAVAWGYRSLKGRNGLGGADKKLFGAIGLWCGLGNLPLLLLGASCLGIAVYAVLRAKKLAGPSSPLPLGTFLAACTIGMALGLPMM